MGAELFDLARDVAEIVVISASVATSGFSKQANRPGAFRRAGYRLRGGLLLGNLPRFIRLSVD